MIDKYFEGVSPRDANTDFEGWDVEGDVQGAVERWRRSIDEFALADACESAMGVFRTVDAFINATEPFKVAKDDSRRDELASILARCIEAIRIGSHLLEPVLPDKMSELHDALSIGDDANDENLDQLVRWGETLAGRTIRKVALFPRIDTPATETAS